MLECGRLVGMFMVALGGACCTTPKHDEKASADRDASTSPPRLGADASTASCGSPANGTRLSAVRSMADDGSWQFEGWYDTERQTRCAAKTAADGVTRCLPSTRTGSQLVYADARCTQRAVVDRRSPCTASVEGPLQHAVSLDRFECGERLHVYALGKNLGPLPSVYQNADGSCSELALEEQGSTSNSEHDVFEVLDELEPDTFVAGEPELVGERLMAVKMNWADGAQNTDAASFDADHGTPCRPELGADLVPRCVPPPTATPIYARADCTEPVIAAPAGCPPALPATELTHYAVSLQPQTDDTCSLPPLNRVFALRDEVRSLEQVYSLSTGRCSAEPVANADYRAVGAELDPSSFARLSLQETECGPYLQSGSRLRTLHLSDEHQAKLDGYFFDTRLSTLCSYFTAEDGANRCLPTSSATGGHYLDEKCTQPAGAIDTCIARSFSGALLAQFIGAYAWLSLEPLDACALPRAAIHPLTGPEQAKGHRHDAEGNCIQVTDPKLVYRKLGPAIDPSEFVAQRTEY